MRFISIRDLKTKLEDILMKTKDEEIIVTFHGKPIAVLSGVTEENLGKKLQAIPRSTRGSGRDAEKVFAIGVR